MKIAVCSLYINDWYQDITKYARKTLDHYCRVHGYDFLYDDGCTNTVYDGTRDIPWYKIKYIEKVLTEYDIIFWVDADCQMYKLDITVEKIMEEHMDDADILIARDWGGILNTGSMIIKNTEWVMNTLDKCWNNKEPFPADFHEQASLADLYTRNVDNAQSHIKILPLHQQNVLFSMWYGFNPNTCFLMHAARCSHDPEGMIYTMDKYCPIKLEEETNEQYQERLVWMNTPELCLTDIESWKQGGPRTKYSARANLGIGSH